MQVARAASNNATSKIAAETDAQLSSSYVPMYMTSSLGKEQFDIELLEKYALDRLKVLKVAERTRKAVMQGTAADGANKVNSLRSAITDAERLHKLNIPRKGVLDSDWETQTRKDEASHFLLRLALCEKSEYRSWLLATEVDLFSTRLQGTGVQFALRAIQRVNGPKVTEISREELNRFKMKLDSVARGPNRQRDNLDHSYYKVVFEEVPSLVRHRRVFLHEGYAFVPARNVMDIVIFHFRTKLGEALETAMKARSVADNDVRMKSILKTIENRFTASDDAAKPFDATAAIDRISLNELNSSIDTMPLCMRNMLQKLRENHHLRYAARIQLGVFLKGCGLTMDESLRFWKVEFSKGNISGDKFDKEYAYSIRHHYGKEGKRRNLTPFACIRIINERPGPAEHNGCPYREFQEGRLKQALCGIGIDGNTASGIAKTAQEGNYQLACGYCFAATQPGHHGVTDQGLPEYIPNHPNEYFIEARRRRLTPQATEVPEASAIADDDLDDEELVSAVEAVEAANASIAGAVAAPKAQDIFKSEEKETEGGEKETEQEAGTAMAIDKVSSKASGLEGPDDGGPGVESGMLESKREERSAPVPGEETENGNTDSLCKMDIEVSEVVAKGEDVESLK